MSSSFSFQHVTRIAFGVGSWRNAAEEIARYGQSALLVTGASSSQRLGVQSELRELLRARAVEVCHFAVPSEPDTVISDLAGQAARSAHAKIVIGLGGGSAMDVAKVAAVLATNPGNALQYLEGVPDGGRRIGVTPLPVVCIPTTAGTGSEVTKNAVLQVPEYQFKRSMRSDQLFPVAAFIDPALSGAAPKVVRAGSGFDALTHLVEAFCSRGANPLTDALARDGITRAMFGLQALARDDQQNESAAELALAACLGGMALANSGLGAAHGLISPLGGLYRQIPHGAGLACILPSTLRENFAASLRAGLDTARLEETARLIAGAEASVDAAAAMLTALRRRLGLFALKDYGSAIDIAAVVAAPSGSVKFNPVPLTTSDLTRIMKCALDES